MEAFFVVVLPHRGFASHRHDPDMCWKQLVILLEGTWFVAAFRPPCTTRGRRSSNAQLGSALLRVLGSRGLHLA